jgi:hypothetical protein
MLAGPGGVWRSGSYQALGECSSSRAIEKYDFEGTGVVGQWLSQKIIARKREKAKVFGLLHKQETRKP